LRFTSLVVASTGCENVDFDGGDICDLLGTADVSPLPGSKWCKVSPQVDGNHLYPQHSSHMELLSQPNLVRRVLQVRGCNREI